MLDFPILEKSIWRDSYTDPPAFPTINKDIETDVVIVGAGITGLTAAYLLKQSGVKVVVLEKHTIASGTSGRTTGKVTSQHNLIYAGMVERLGKEAAQIYADANQTGVDTVRRIITKNRLDCDWQQDDNYVFTVDGSRVASLKKEARVAASLGLPASFVTSTPLPFKVSGALKFTGQGKINTQKYLLGLAKLINGNGSHVYENSQVTHFHDGEPAYVTANQKKITAKNIIVATKIPSSPLFARAGYARFEYPTESYGIACISSNRLQGMYISVDRDHHSIFPHKINGKNVLLIVGAGGNIPGLRFGKQKRYDRLAAYAEKHFHATAITHKWSDMDYFPYDGFPLVGRVYHSSKHLYTATGYMKWGLSNGTAAAIMLHDIVTGRNNPWTPAFESMRSRQLSNIPRAIYKHLRSASR